jgi:polyhydroxyalkanoate synthase
LKTISRRGSTREKTCFALDQWGHIAGVVNTPDAGQYGFRTGELKAGESAKELLSGAAQLEGSRWPDWQAWQSRRAGKKVAACEPSAGKLEIFEDASGSYLKVRT